MNRNTFWIIGIIIGVVLLSTQTSAIGISPSKKIIDYDTEQHIITSKIINNEGRDIDIIVSANGPLSEYIFIAQPVISIRSNELEKEFTYVLQLPPGIDPGPKIISITISESETNISDASERALGGKITLTQQLQVNVPYSGVYAEGYVSVYPVDANEPITALCEIFNKGDENIESITGKVRVLDAYNNTVYTKNLSVYEKIAPGTSIRVEDSFLLTEIGEYVLVCDINYDNRDLSIDKKFTLGDYNITVLSANVNNFRLGTVAKFNIDFSNKWNKPIDNVYGTIFVKNTKGKVVGQTNITQTTLNPKINSITAYLDTIDILPGQYIIEIKLYAGSKVITHEYKSIISNNKIILGINETTETETSDHQNYTLTIVLIFTTIGILIILLLKQNKKLYK